MKTGLLLLNLGTPDSPEPADVRRYLDEFLSDARVLDIPAWKRRLVLELFILPRRPKASGEAYAKIWTERGSPLLFHSRDLVARVQEKLGPEIVVDLAMRYGNPSIPAALERFRVAGIDRIVLFPLYPQYASASTGSTIERVFEEAGRRWNTPFLQVIPPFYDHPGYIDAFAAVAEPVVREVRPERVLFSFHGLPERQVQKSDETGDHCLRRDDCCDAIGKANRNCYRAQCTRTARLLADRMGVPEPQRVLCFQSRLGRTPWIKPYTDLLVRTLAQDGVKRAVILSPGFVADCLETLEELGIRAAADFRAHGGERLQLVPSLNATPAWVDAVVAMVRETSGPQASVNAAFDPSTA